MEKTINCSFITAPNAIAVIKSVPRDTKSGVRKLKKKKKINRRFE